MPKIVGIDLGTTNSLVAIVEDGTPRVIPGADGNMLVPSVIYFDEGGNVLVGNDAKAKMVEKPTNTIFSIKRFMGKGIEDVREDLPLLPFDVSKDSEHIIRLTIFGKDYTPPHLSAFILRELKRNAEAALGEEIVNAVITVPAYFNDAQRQATKDAGRIAGLDVLRIVNEPTAASLAYGMERLAEGIIAVYDLGGGTFDISILRVKDGIFEVLATNGNTHLGGDDFDRTLVEWLLEDVEAAHGADLSKDPEAMQELRLGAEAAKCRLSFEERTSLTIPFETFTYRREITRADVEARIGQLVDATLGPCRMALKDAGMTAGQVDEGVLVGGSTRRPLVRQRGRGAFRKTPHH